MTSDLPVYGGDGQPPYFHTFVRGLLQTLPPTGTAWPPSKRAEWLELAENVFKIIYKDQEPAEQA